MPEISLEQLREKIIRVQYQMHLLGVDLLDVIADPAILTIHDQYYRDLDAGGVT